MIPRLVAATMDEARPTSPTKIAHKPKATTTGSRLGTRLISPNFRLARAKISNPEISTRASVVPRSMLLMLRSDI